VPFFRDSDPFFISQLLTELYLEHFAPGDLIVEQGAKGDKMYFIVSGSAQVIVGTSKKHKLHSGDYFGGVFD
jgi:hyperpolarization activated cyclic nucleotide-gated potassium channel 1